MKPFVFLFVLLTAAAARPAAAQRLYKGQQSLSVSAGFVDNYYLQRQDNAGYYLRLEFGRVDRRRNSWALGIQGSVKYYDYRGVLTPVAQYVGDVGYQIPLLYNYRRNYALSFQLGANAGYEAIDAARRDFPDGARVAARDRFIYGAYVGGNFRVYLSNRVALFADFKERFLANSDIALFHSNLGVGLQLMLYN